MSEPTVPTTRGDIPVAELGRTLMHEHIFTSTLEITLNYPDTFGVEDELVADAVAKLEAATALGIRTLVDLTVIGLGRYLPRVLKVARQVDMNIIVATGIYPQSELPRFFQMKGPGAPLGGPEPMEDLFVRDIEVGIADTGVRAGILKCATEQAGLTYGIERSLRAVARAHRRTGVPIATHASGSPSGLLQQQVFAEEGVDLTRVIIGHVGDTTDVDYVQRLLDNGSYVGMDRFGIGLGFPPPDGFLGDRERAAAVARLCEMGYAEQIVLSHDAAAHRDLVRADGLPMAALEYTHISRVILPLLRELGVTDAQIDQMMIGNPARIFSRSSAY